MSSRKLLIAGVAGALGLWAGFPNNFFQFPPAVFLWPLALVCLGVYAPNPGRALSWGWLCTFCGMTGVLYWLYLPVYNVGKLPVIAALGCALFICACLAVQGALFSMGAFFLRQAGIFSYAVILSLLWYLLEYLFALIIGFPWLPLCGAFPSWPFLMQGANITGGYLLGAIWFLGILLIIFGIVGKFETRIYPDIKCLASGALIIILLTLYGVWRLEPKPYETDFSAPESMTALFIEGNVDQNQKWEKIFQTTTLNLYMRLSLEGLRALPPKDKENLLLLWPETALPFFLETNRPFANRLMEFVREIDQPLLFGAPGLEEEKSFQDSLVFNRAYLVNPDGKIEGFYDKEHLVPFGEYLPHWLKLDFLEPLLQGVGIYEAGKNPSPLRYASLALGMLICYEGIFPWLAQERVARGANILVDISNDGWFEKSPAAKQHLHLTLIRCVEQNRWLLRSTNTGISAIADNLGRIHIRGKSFVAGYLYGNARLIKEKSPYHYMADYIPWTAMTFFTILLVWILYKTRSIQACKQP